MADANGDAQTAPAAEVCASDPALDPVNGVSNGITHGKKEESGARGVHTLADPPSLELDSVSQTGSDDYIPNVYHSFDDFRVLDELDGRFCVVDWTEGEKSFMWGSYNHLQCYNMTQEELNNWNFKDQSAAANEYHRSVYQAVQIERGHVSKLKTAYPKGKPVTAIQNFRPIELHLPKWEVPRTVMLMELKEPIQEVAASQQAGTVQNQSSSKSDTGMWGLAEEMLRYTEVIAMMFDCESESLEYENQSCKLFYEQLNAHPQTPVGQSTASFTSAVSITSATSSASTKPGQKRKLTDVFDTCVWETPAAREAALKEVRALTITSGRLEFECQKTPQNLPFDHSRDAVWHKIHFIPCLNPGSGKPSLIVNEYDVTKLKVQADLIAASRSQEQFFAAVSHELRTPLNGLAVTKAGWSRIIGLSGSLLQNSSCNEQMTKTLKLIQSSGQRLAGLVNDILDAASAKRNTFSIKHEMLELWEISQSVCEVLSPLVRNDRVKLVNNIKSNLPHIEGDSQRVNQILTNIVSNAIKFTERGTISLSATVLKDKEILVEVVDTGIGIPENKLDQVWAPFKQVDMSTTRKYGGTGLGLSLVKELVEAHHGRVGVKSEHGVESTGSNFFFVLPLRQPQKEGVDKSAAGGDDSAELVKEYREAAQLASVSKDGLAEPEPSTPTAGGGEDSGTVNKRAMHHSDLYDSFEILSVDDNLVNHIVVENSLVPRGYKVTTCMSGPEALELIDSRGFLPDLILLDCMMPTMSGCEMCEQLRLSYPCNTLPVIMVSAKDQEDDIVKGLKSGCNDYLAKPYGVNELNARIDVQLKLKYLWHLEIQRMLSDRGAILQVPQEVVDGGELTAHNSVTVLVCEVEDMLLYVQKLPPNKLAAIINSLYDALDAIAVHEGASRVLDDAYMIVLGDDKTTSENQSRKAMQIGRKMLEEADKIKVQLDGQEDTIRLRIGVAAGKAYSCMVGLQLPYYTYFGQAVRDACEVCNLGHPGCVLVTAEVHSTVPHAEDVLTTFPLLDTAERSISVAYIAKLGDYNEALEAASKPARLGSLNLDKARKEANESATSHLRAFLRLSVQSDQEATPRSREGELGSRGRESEFGSMGDSKQGDCPSCLELRLKVQELDEKLKVSTRKAKGLSSEATISELTRTTSTAFNTRAPSGVEHKRHNRVEEIEILSVDDDPVNQMVVENLLLPVGYKVTACMDGMEALQYIMSCSRLPDLLLLDVMMPEMSGLQVCERIREMYNRTTLPVIMVSARSSVECIVEGLEAGCNDYVSKPFNRVELLARISTQLRVRDASRAEVEHVRSAKLLQKMLPEHVITKLTTNPSMIVEEHKSVSMLFSSIVGYSTLSCSLPTMELIQMLNRLNTLFDDLCDKHGCFKVETNEDTYVVVAGHESGDDDHAESVLRMALDMLEAVKQIEYPRHPGKHLQVRIGIHSGPAYAGIVGNKMLRYCFFGDTVTIARGMEKTGFAMNVQVSSSTREKLAGRWQLVDAGTRNIKDQGSMQAFVIKESRCAWESALTKASHSTDDKECARQVMLHSSSASFNIKHLPAASDSASARRGSMSHEELHLLEQMEAVASDTHDTDLQIVKEKLSHFVSQTKRSMPSALTPGQMSPPRSVAPSDHVAMAVAHRLELDRKDEELAEAVQQKDEEIAELEEKQEQTTVQVMKRDQRILELEKLLADALMKSHDAEQRAKEAAPDSTRGARGGAALAQPPMLGGPAAGPEGTGAQCKLCKENVAKAEDALFALEMSRTDNSKLIATCALLTQQAQQRDDSHYQSHHSLPPHPAVPGHQPQGGGGWGAPRSGGTGGGGEQSLVNLFVQQQSMIFDRLETNAGARGALQVMMPDPSTMRMPRREPPAMHMGDFETTAAPEWATPSAHFSARPPSTTPAHMAYSGMVHGAARQPFSQERAHMASAQHYSSQYSYIPSPDDVPDASEGLGDGGRGMDSYMRAARMHGRRP